MFEVIKAICIGCGTCADLCPEGAISLAEDETAEIDQQKCAACGVCAGICPQEAIEEIEEVEDTSS